MSLERIDSRNGSTSASGPMAPSDVPAPRLAGVFFALVVGTSAGNPLVGDALANPLPDGMLSRTNAGSSVPEDPRPGAAISELRRLSGLTWEQLARLFRVSRRTVHFWASGERMASPNEEHLRRLLAFIRRVDRGFAAENRALLLRADEPGGAPLDLLANGEIERAFSMVGPGTDAPRSMPRPLGKAEWEARKPLPPDVLADARHDVIHRDPKGGRAPKSVRAKRGRA